MAEILDFPVKEEVKEEELTEEFPIAKFGYIDNVAAQVFGDDLGFSCTAAKTPEGANVVVMYVGSLVHEEIMRKAVFELNDLKETRKACIVLAYEIYVMEQQYEASHGSKLIVPNQGLILPGK